MSSLGFYLSGRFVPYYGFMIALGLLLNIPLAYIQIRRFRLSIDNFMIICGISGLFGILGAKMLYLLVSVGDLDFSRIKDISYIGAIMRGGFVFFGGIIGLFFALLFCKRRLGITVQPYLQACLGCVPIAHGFGRIGCLLAGCCYGIPYGGRFSVVYTNSGLAPCGIGLFPVQLVEALLEWIIGGCLLAFSPKLKGNLSLFLYLLVYSLVRFCLEFFRYDERRGELGGLSTSQLLGLLIATFSVCQLFKEFQDFYKAKHR